jgi:hypothetical protein
MTAAPSLPSQIASLNAACDLIAANGKAIEANGWGRDMDQALIDLARVRQTLEWLSRNQDVIRQALAKPASDGNEGAAP